VRFGLLKQAALHWRLLSIAWVANFLIIPPLGFAIASLFLTGQPPFLTGLVIYFMAPCTDWFLGFTRLAKGNTALGAILLPINMVTQLLLYPVYLSVFLGANGGVEASTLTNTLWQWFLIPAVIALVTHITLRRILNELSFETLLCTAGKMIPFVIAALVFFIFSANITIILEHIPVFVWILCAVFLFFVVTYFLGEGLSKLFKLDYPERALLTMTTAARNAPLMLGITAAVMPNQPLIYEALIIGMLAEFPHLTVLKHLMLRTERRFSATPVPEATS
jgi:ACR3 family arsenite efflux pump ArsB